MQNLLGIDPVNGFLIFIKNFGNALITWLLMLIYNIFLAIVYILEFTESLFRKLAGIEEITYSGKPYGGEAGSDLLYAFITNPTVSTTFFTLLGFSVVLLIIFTIVAMVKSEFTLDASKAAKLPILSRAFKALSQFFIVPIFVMLGIFASNMLTKAVYSVFSGDGTPALSSYCFRVGASSANRARNDTKFANYLKYGFYLNTNISENTLVSKDNIFSGANASTVADYVDCYMTGIGNLGTPTVEKKFNDKGEYSTSGSNDKTVYKINIVSYHNYTVDQAYNLSTKGRAPDGTLANGNGDEDKIFDSDEKEYYFPWHTYLVGTPKAKTDDSACNKPYLNALLVNYYYDLTKFDYVLAIGCGCVLAWNFLVVCLGLLKRVFEMTILFLLSPAVIALGPLDGGKAYGNWRNDVISRMFAVVGPLFAYTIFTVMVTLIGNISVFGEGPFGKAMNTLFDLLFKTIAIIVASGLLKTTAGFISSYLGIKDLLAEGNGVMSSAGKTIARGAMVATGALAAGGKIAHAAKAGFSGTASMIKGFAGKVSSWGSDEAHQMRENKKELKDLARAEKKVKRDSRSDPESAEFDMQEINARKAELNKRNAALKAQIESGDVHKGETLKKNLDEAQEHYDRVFRDKTAPQVEKDAAKAKLERAKKKYEKYNDEKYSSFNKNSAEEREALKEKAKLVKGKAKEKWEEAKETAGNVFNPKDGWKAIASRFAGGFGGDDSTAMKLISMFAKKDGRKAFYESSYEKKHADDKKKKEEKNPEEEARLKKIEELLKQFVAWNTFGKDSEEYNKYKDMLEKRKRAISMGSDSSTVEKMTAEIKNFETANGINADSARQELINNNEELLSEFRQFKNELREQARKDAQEEVKATFDNDQTLNVEGSVKTTAENPSELTGAMREALRKSLERPLKDVQAGVASLLQILKGEDDDTTKS